MKLYYLAILFIVASLDPITSQAVEISAYGSVTKSEIITSGNGKEYKITVTIPREFSGELKYKVLYYLDAWWLKETICGANALALLSKNIEPIVLVGISAEGDELNWHLQRNYDYTPSPYNKDLMGFTLNAGLAKLDSASTGGANEFIQFLENDVFEYIAKNYPNVEDKGFIGHSFGGLLGVYIVRNRPEIFKNVILISPSVWWNRSEILAEEMFDTVAPKLINTKIYLSVGGAEAKLLTRSVSKLDSLLSNMSEHHLLYKYEIFDHANHNSVIPQSVYNGLDFMYGLKNAGAK